MCKQHLLAEVLGFVQVVPPQAFDPAQVRAASCEISLWQAAVHTFSMQHALQQRPSISVVRRIASSALPKPGDKVTCKVSRLVAMLGLEQDALFVCCIAFQASEVLVCGAGA